MSDFKLIKSNRKYQIIKVSENLYRLVRVLKEYENREDAVRDLQRLLRNEITDSELEKDGY